MNLVGKEITLSVGEPWDYESPDGSNLIHARVVSFDQGGRAERLTAEADREVTVPRKASGTRLIIEARHRDASLNDVAIGKRVVVSVAIVPTGKPDKSAKYAIIGDIFLKGHEPESVSGFD